MTDADFWKKEKELPRAVLVRTQYINIGGSLATGVLLSQIVYWTKPSKDGTATKMRITKNGRLWIAKSREEWMSECMLSLWQYKQGIKVLTDMGLIETERHLFRGVITPYIRLNIDELKRRVFALNKDEASSENPTMQEQTLDNNHSPIGRKLATQLAGIRPNITESMEKNTTQNKNIGTSSGEAEATAKTPQKNSEETKNKIKHNGSLEELWLKHVGKNFPGHQKPWTAVDRGKAKHLKMQLSAATTEVVACVLQRWSLFGTYVCQTKGHEKAPLRPSLGYLLKHCDVAMNMAVTLNEAVLPK